MVKYGLILSCQNLQKMKKFYTDLLQLDLPVIDRIDWVEFYQKDTASTLCMQQANIRETNNHIACFHLKNYEEIVTKLTDANYQLSYKKNLPIIQEHQFFNDPENNTFVLIKEK